MDRMYSPACLLLTTLYVIREIGSGIIELCEEALQKIDQDTAPEVGMSVLFEISLGEQSAAAHDEIYLMGQAVRKEQGPFMTYICVRVSPSK